MHKLAPAAIFAAVIISAANAAAIEQPKLNQIASELKSWVGRRIRITNAICVDDPKGGFTCLATAGGRTIRVDASGLGMAGGDEVAERLIGPCKGLDKLTSAACKFDVDFEVSNALSEAVMLEFEGQRVTKLYAGVIDMRLPKRR